MKFRFPYEKLLNHRENLEEIARKEFMIAKGRVDEAESELREMFDATDEARRRIGNLESRGGKQGASLVQIDEFIDGQKIRIQRQREKIRMLKSELERRQEALTAAARDRKTIEKIKERRLLEHKAEIKKLELKEIDDIVTTRYKRGES